MKPYKRSLFIFRRDLRIVDNTALNQALLSSNEVISCFIVDPIQVEKKNQYRSNNAIQFMIKSLKELDLALKKKKSKLYLLYGSHADVIKKLINSAEINAVFVNRDYTPFSLKRDELLEKICIQQNCAFVAHHDLLLTEPEKIMNSNGTPYSIFTSFYKRASMMAVAKPNLSIEDNFFNKPIKISTDFKIFSKILSKQNKFIWVEGGRNEALKILKKIDTFKNYAKTRDFPDKATTNLSAHLKFGTISIREAYWTIVEKLGNSHPLIRQLYWRDFFTYVAYHSPFVFGQAFHEKYNKFPWKNNRKEFKAWSTGTTGFPIIDAGMRQLNKTGWMHNRVRMLVASYLVKDLHIDWRLGEKYFAQQLVDYDPCVNNGNWQWNASTGCDAQPYFRIFNPWLQQKKFDRDCHYIKRWVPELKNINPKVIHTWYNLKNAAIKKYPRPIVDHKKESIKSKLQYKKM